MSIGRGWVRSACGVGPRESEAWPPDEAALLRAGQAGDREALDRLLAPHEAALFALCRDMLGHAQDAEDAAQEAFLRALRALPRFQPGLATFRTWLFRIAVNVCLNRKRDRRPTEVWDDERLACLVLAASPEVLALSRLQIMEALSQLSPRQRAIFLLRVRDGWSIPDIAAVMGWKGKRVENALYRARRALAEWQARVLEEGAER